MASESRLEIFLIVLDRTFRDMVTNKWAVSPNATDIEVFNEIFQKFLLQLSQNSSWQSKKNKQGLSLFPSINGQRNLNISEHSNNKIIEGYIDGGNFDAKRDMADKDDTTQTNAIGKNALVTHRHYFYLYTPLDERMGVVMIERKKNNNISSTFKEFLAELFHVPRGRKIGFNPFISKAELEDIQNNGLITGITFYNTSFSGNLGNDEADHQEMGYLVTINIKPPKSIAPKYNDKDRLLNLFLNSAFRFGIDGDNIPLNNFSRFSGEVTSKGKRRTFTFGEDGMELIPDISIPEEWFDDDKYILDRQNIKRFCDSKLEEVRNNHAI